MRISDWSSDVCSSDLPSGARPDAGGMTYEPVVSVPLARGALGGRGRVLGTGRRRGVACELLVSVGGTPGQCREPLGHLVMVRVHLVELAQLVGDTLEFRGRRCQRRTEERRVGKECVSTGRSRGAPVHEKKKKK